MLGREATTAAGNSVSKYWKNGVQHIVAGYFPFSANFNHIAVHNNDVYISGYEYDPSLTLSRAVYYKNDVITWLTNGANTAAAEGGILVNGSDVYILGYETNASGKAVATYWKNGTKTMLGDAVTNSELTNGFIKGSDIYCLGFLYNNPTLEQGHYWKNGTATKVYNGAGKNFARAIYVQ